MPATGYRTDDYGYCDGRNCDGCQVHGVGGPMLPSSPGTGGSRGYAGPEWYVILGFIAIALAVLAVAGWFVWAILTYNPRTG